MSRYENKVIAINDHPLYANLFKERGVNFIRQYKTPRLRHPTSEEIAELTLRSKIWSVGDRFYKLAHDYYGDATRWDIIAWFNRKPTEAHVELGEVIYVPLPLDKVLILLGL